MKLLSVILFVLLAASSSRAIVGAARGSGGNNTAATTLTINPASDFSNPSMGVLCIAVDNAGTGGNTAISPTSVNDSDGNTWTRRAVGFQDPGAASAGVEISVYTASITTNFQTTDNITITWGGSTSPTAKAWTLTEFTASSGGNIVSYLDSGVGSGGNDGAPSVTTASVTSNDAVVGWGGAESADTWAGDSDTTNGNWTTKVSTGFGSGNTGMSIISQRKPITGAGTQSFDPTLTAADRIVGWIAIRESTPVARRPVTVIG